MIYCKLKVKKTNSIRLQEKLMHIIIIYMYNAVHGSMHVNYSHPDPLVLVFNRLHIQIKVFCSHCTFVTSVT